MYGWRARIGLLTVADDAVMECDFWRMAPPGVSVHVARMHYDQSIPRPIDRLVAMAPHARQGAVDLGSVGVAALVYGCTSGSYFRGPGWERAYMRELEVLAGRPVVSTARAVAEAVRSLGLRRIGVISPYADEVNALLAPYLAESGIEVAHLVEGTQPVCAAAINGMPVEEIGRLARQALRPGIQGLFFSCTAVPMLDVIDGLEDDLGLAVVTANQASFWAALRRAGVATPLPGFGQLFEMQLLGTGAAEERDLTPA